QDTESLTPEDYYNNIKFGDIQIWYNFNYNRDDVSDSRFSCAYDTSINDDYVPFQTEKQLKEILDVDGFDVGDSPLFVNTGERYWWHWSIGDGTSVKISKDDITTGYTIDEKGYYSGNTEQFYISNETLDEFVVKCAKVGYCLNQVMLFSYCGEPGYVPATAGKLYGEANEDGILNIMDASFIARKLAQQKGSELPETADFNADGEIDIRDAADIAQFMAARAAAQAEGWIE
ncbi:dockerin type I domain-containing protein, partial [Porcipelethomonas sp.]|uniref:dockerin type I domain-containing protein n=1 Tax=Porcipelethomonas sp. TaxID=2981675 RepID=UPI003EF6E79D